MEVGPLARLLVAFASGRTDVQELVKETLASSTCPSLRSSPRWPYRGSRPGCGAGMICSKSSTAN